eukprot:m.505570 g.505570  ORF g.505570 m.505570 type:complete len:84 (+) comp21863_c0_seq52:134-385(+)
MRNIISRGAMIRTSVEQLQSSDIAVSDMRALEIVLIEMCWSSEAVNVQYLVVGCTLPVTDCMDVSEGALFTSTLASLASLGLC